MMLGIVLGDGTEFLNVWNAHRRLQHTLEVKGTVALILNGSIISASLKFAPRPIHVLGGSTSSCSGCSRRGEHWQELRLRASSESNCVSFESSVEEDFSKLDRGRRVSESGQREKRKTLTSTISFNLESESAHMSIIRHSHSRDTRGWLCEK